MRLFLIRHGTAEKRDPEAQDSPNRRLVDKGHQQIRALSSLLASFVNENSLFFSSTYLRAVDSAVVFSEFLGLEPTVDQTATLIPEADPKDFLNYLATKIEDDGEVEQTVFAFGHEPHISRCVSRILNSANMPIRIKKGGAVEIRFDNGLTNPELHGLLRPRYYPVL